MYPWTEARLHPRSQASHQRPRQQRHNKLNPDCDLPSQRPAALLAGKVASPQAADIGYHRPAIPVKTTSQYRCVGRDKQVAGRASAAAPPPPRLASSSSAVARQRQGETRIPLRRAQPREQGRVREGEVRRGKRQHPRFETLGTQRQVRDRREDPVAG
ncbi:hypothetical protein J3458_007284 [Metarhizium acridum]|uniref:uncharacterized protein n=1 Tax=Metarhizium acridum TaxID=92637 RepID=UPI001C6C1EBE|nr:hypothetical protein J3458_007284 [Metarhizium acridum]